MLEVGQQYMRLQIWDTAGQERFRSITSAYFRGLNVAMLVYDVSNRSSFDGITDWVSLTKQHARPDIRLMLMGCKTDLERSVSYCEGAQLAEQLGALFVETSAKAGSNMKQAFYLLTLMLKA